jgi:hypothetical protein
VSEEGKDDTVSDQTREAAGRAADAIRELVRLTGDGQDHLRSPVDVSGIAAGLQLIGGQLPRLLAHLASWLATEGRARRIGYDGSDHARYWIGQVNACLSEALAGADQMAAALDEAHHAARGLTPADGAR